MTICSLMKNTLAAGKKEYYKLSLIHIFDHIDAWTETTERLRLEKHLSAIRGENVVATDVSFVIDD